MPEFRRTSPLTVTGSRMVERLLSLAVKMMQVRTPRQIARLQADLLAQAAVIASQAASLEQSRKIFDRASAAAKIGVWQCRLPCETLEWTDMVYDIFDLPRGTSLDRTRTLGCYTPESAEQLRRLRDRAIQDCGGFSMDAEITTALGNRRWIRITATVECEDGVPVRIFGMKQDITEEKILADRTRYLAEFDVMTGLANRSQFQSRLDQLDEAATGDNRIAALMLVDLDGFKSVNDTFGHAVGDACLIRSAERLRIACSKAELVARIGGDEFAVLIGAGHDRADVAGVAREIVEALGRPIEQKGHSLGLGASVGVAFTADCASSDLFTMADIALYAAKAAGKSTFRVYKPGQDAVSRELTPMAQSILQAFR
ncbi:diguanylate cyclase (GGDEF)-like protein [Hoeflea marina]|uniref:Diguanylate cyclase (GGDEF)-like protein n=1 Tax=Hoeflea marina TaxID=274592 RepID=A0A317PH96_9HYPH|nr:diguanylate cyclase [Hoeflea marina]PWV97215.1 diguanylate cyclase (GGDEF)-like protein [Hoeflea marina]